MNRSRLSALLLVVLIVTACPPDGNMGARNRASSPTQSPGESSSGWEIAYTCIPDIDAAAGDICAAPLEGPEFRLTDAPTDEIDPSWSPDGQWIVYRVNTRIGSDLFILNVATGARRNLTREESSGNYSPAWSPDGKRIAYAAEREGDVTTGIYIIDVNGGEPIRITPPGVWGEYPAWSPDGSRIVFSRNMSGFSSADFDIYVMNADGSDLTPLVTEPGSDGEPAWSPDGTRIAYDHERKPGGCESGEACSYDVWVVNADGSGRTQLTRGKGAESSMFPDWSPDGRRLLFFFQDDDDAEDTRGVFTMYPDGSNVTRLPIGGDWPDWR